MVQFHVIKFRFDRTDIDKLYTKIIVPYAYSEATKTFTDLMGSDVEARRTFIETNAKFVVNLDA